MFRPIYLIILLCPYLAFSNDCRDDAFKHFSHPIRQHLSSRLTDPSYKVLILARHGKASSENKFTRQEREDNPELVVLDIQRPLKKKGRRAALRLAELLGKLPFREVGMWGSHALRVRSTAQPTRDALGERVKIAEFEENLYYADVPREMEMRLTSGLGRNLPQAFFWGHGKTTLELYKRLTGAERGFLPTAAVMIVALKADSWEQVFNRNSERVEAYGWSPNDSHYVEGGDTQMASLEESVGGLESMVVPSNIDQWSFEVISN